MGLTWRYLFYKRQILTHEVRVHGFPRSRGSFCSGHRLLVRGLGEATQIVPGANFNADLVQRVERVTVKVLLSGLAAVLLVCDGGCDEKGFWDGGT